MAPTLLLLLLLLWPQGCTSGVPAESVYSKVQHFEGETLSVQCSYKSRKKHVEGKVWCKIRKKKCEPGFTRIWAQGPRYLLQDDAQAKVVNITMVALRRQDSGRYWCMRNSSGTLYPLMGFQLEVSPVPTAERNTPLTQLANILKSGIVITTGRDPTSGPGAPFPSSVRMFTPGVLTLARLLPSTASGTIRLSSMTGYSFTSPSTPGPRGTERLQTVPATPSHARASSAGPASVSTKAGQLGTGSPTTRLCHTNRSLLNKLSPIRRQDSNLTVLAGVLTFLSVPVMMMAGYGFWKKRHRGSYSMCRDPSRPWRDPPGRPKPPWKPTWFKATYAVGELFAETPRGHTRSEDGDLSGLEPGWGVRTCACWAQASPNQRLHRTRPVPWASRNLGRGPEPRTPRRKSREAPEGILLRATGLGPQLHGVYRQSLSSHHPGDPYHQAEGSGGGVDSCLSTPGPCVLSFLLLPSSFPMDLGNKESQKQPVSQWPSLGEEEEQ